MTRQRLAALFATEPTQSPQPLTALRPGFACAVPQHARGAARLHGPDRINDRDAAAAP